MKKTVDMIKEELVNAWESNGYGKYTIELGDYSVTVSPCCYDDEKSLENCEYFLTYFSELPWLDGSSFDKLCGNLAKLDELVADADAEKDKFWASLRAAQESGTVDYDWYSDWHKDLYGYRPRGLF